MTTSRYYIKQLTSAELGEAKTHEKYIRLTNDFPYEEFFQTAGYQNGTVTQIDFTAYDKDNSNEAISLKFIYYANSNKEKRIPSIGNIFDTRSVKVNDVVVLESVTTDGDTKIYISFKTPERITINPSTIYYTIVGDKQSYQPVKSAEELSLQLITSDDPTKFIWSCIKLFNERKDLEQLFTSKYKSFGGTIGNYIKINGCYVAQIGKSDIKEIESIQIYDGSFLNAGFDARDIEQFKDAVNDVFRGKYKIEIEQKDSQTIYKLIQLQINPDYRPYITAIKSKPFLLLAGISGTGKSRIVRELARACWDAGSEEYKAHKPSNFEMVQVKPNWHDSSELLGYVSRVSGEPVYVAGPFLKFVAKAWENPDVPYFLCLDEMNLAPVEQYFAEYLSVVESRKAEDGVIKTDPILDKVPQQWYFDLVGSLTEIGEVQDRFKKDGICIPQNLIVVGTVNMDETTFSFSRKVLDRAMTIEMNEVDLTCGLDKRHETIGKLDKSHLIGTAVEGCDVYNAYKADCDIAIAYLNAVNQHLEKTPFKVAYRTRNEFLLYVVNNLPYNKDQDGKDVQPGWLLARALDEITCMKVLSSIEGDETKVSKEFLSELTKEIKTQLEKLSGCTYTADRAEENKESNVWYSRSLDKLDEMTKRLESGYTSFWS